MNNSDFTWNVHSYLSGYIVFGDTKAAFLCGSSVAAIGWLYRSVPYLSSGEIDLASGIGVIAILVFAISFVFGFRVILPDLSTLNLRPSKHGSEAQEPKNGFIYWRNILAHANHNTFANKLNNLSNDDQNNELAIHCYELARIVDRKYLLISWAAWSFFLGMFLLAAFVGFQSVSGIQAGS